MQEMLENSEIAVAEAVPVMPQGQTRLAKAMATQIATDGATTRLPRGQKPCAQSVATQIEGAANKCTPQGQGSIAASLDHLCGQLMKLQRDRRFAIRQQMRCDNAALAYVRSLLGFRTDATEADRKKISAEAKRIMKAVESGEDHLVVADEAIKDVALSCSAVILRNTVARSTWDEMRVETEKQMRELAHELPAWAFAKSVRGLSDLGFAAIVGEAGNLGEYPKKGHLWKRLGLAVIDGNRQGNPGSNATAEDWIAHGYNKQRRAEVYAFVDDVLLRAQWRGAKDDAPGYAIGPYGEYYSRKKAEYLSREWTPGHADKAARRYMAKMLVRDLWNAWRGADKRVSEDQTFVAPRRAA